MQGVIGAFRELDATVDAIEELKKQRLGDITVYSPTPRHELEHAIDAAAERGAALHAHRRPAGRDVRLLDRDLDLGLLAARRRRQADRDLGAVHDHRLRGDGARRRALDGVRHVRQLARFRGSR